MKLEQSFEVDAPLERVWQALIDVERVAPALPGAAVTGRNDDGSYGGTFTVKIGPTTASYAGKLEMEEVDESAHRAVMQANGSDKRGQGGAKATIVSQLSEVSDGGTRVEVSTDYHITGRLARFGRGGMIEDISKKLLGEFAKRLQQELTGDGAAAPESAAASQAPAAGASAAAAPDGSEGPAASEGAAASSGSDGAQTPPASEATATTSEQEAAATTPERTGSTGEAQPSPPEPGIAAPPPPPPPRPGVPPAEPLQAGSLIGSVLIDRVKRNPLPLAFLAGLLVAFALLRRARHSD